MSLIQSILLFVAIAGVVNILSNLIELGSAGTRGRIEWPWFVEILLSAFAITLFVVAATNGW